MTVREINSGGVKLAAEDAGEGSPVVLLHGLTATRRYVVMGSTTLERSDHHVVQYDARAHGQSAPAPSPQDYGYEALCADLEAVLDAYEIERAVLAGASMGAHTLLRFALDQPDRVTGLCVITPAHDPDRFDDPLRLARWDALAEGLRTGGVDGFVAAYDIPSQVPEQWQETVEKVIRQRIAAHENPDAMADTIRAVPRSEPFGGLEDLAAITAPTTVVVSHDDADPGHPFALGEAYAEAIPGARFVTEDEGKSPIAWQGGQLSRLIAELATQEATA